MHFKSIPIYFSFNAMAALLPIMAMPILTRYLTQADYGLITTFLALLMFVGTALRFELNVALKREFVDEKDNFKNYLATACSFSIIIFLTFFSLVAMMTIFTIDVGVPVVWLPAIVVIVYMKNQTMKLVHLWQVSDKSLQASLTGFVTLLMTYGLTVIAVLFFVSDWEARIYGELIATVSIFLFTALYLKKTFLEDIQFGIDIKLIREMLSLAVPLIIPAFLLITFQVTDKIFINQIIGVEILGDYAIAIQLSGAMAILVRSVQPVWESWVFSGANTQTKTKEKKVLIGFLILAVLGGVVVLVLAPLLTYILPILVDEKFLNSEILILPCLVSALMLGLYNLSKMPLIYKKNSKAVMHVSLVMFPVNIVLMYVFVNTFGAAGAAYAVSVTFSVGILMNLYLQTKQR